MPGEWGSSVVLPRGRKEYFDVRRYRKILSPDGWSLACEKVRPRFPDRGCVACDDPFDRSNLGPDARTRERKQLASERWEPDAQHPAFAASAVSAFDYESQRVGRNSVVPVGAQPADQSQSVTDAYASVESGWRGPAGSDGREPACAGCTDPIGKPQQV